MKRISKRLVSLWLAVMLLAGLTFSAQVTAFAEEDPYHATGYCGAEQDGKNVQYFLFDDGSIAFFGTGAMKNFGNPGVSAPAGEWYLNNPMEALLGSKIALEDGVTTVGDYAFYLPTMYTFVLQTYNIDLPNSLTTIGVSAFENQNKIEKITIPKNVTKIGARAFYGCTKLVHVDYYGDPENIKQWADNVFSQNVTVHIKPEYVKQVSDLNAAYNAKHMFFEANLHADNLTDDGVTRNIKAYVGQESSKIFAGAVPSVVVGTFSGSKKSVTAGNNGFVSAVKIGDDYYLHTNNHSGDLNKANIATGGVASSVVSTAHESLKLQIRYEYVGKNIVTVIYELSNNGNSDVSKIQLGGTGDIKIGADDTARIEPLMENNEQIGFYMKSGKEYDKDTSNHYATLGFIGKKVEFTNQNKEKQTSAPATFFYGKAGTPNNLTATGAYQLRLIPERIFTMNNSEDAKSYSSGAFPEDTNTQVDSGMSYYWDIAGVPAGGTVERAVMFSVYGADDSHEGKEMIDEVKATYHTVTWLDGDDHEILKQVVKHNEAAVYDGATPEKKPNGSTAYQFNNTWKVVENSQEGEIYGGKAITDDTTLKAQFTEIPNPNKLFKGHAISLDGDIGVYFYLDKNEVDTNGGSGKMCAVHFSWTVKGEEKTSSAYFTIGNPDTKEVTIDNKTVICYRVKCDVPAPEMAYSIHAVAYIDGKEHWDKDDYSVKEYGEYIIANSGAFGDKLTKLAQEMLNYGAKCQIIFDRVEASAPLANEKYTGYTMKAITAADFDTAIEKEPKNVSQTKSDMRASTGDLNYCGSSVVYLTKTSLRHYYTVKGGTYNGTYTINGDNTAYAFTSKDVFVYAEIQNIAASELDVLQKVTFNGQTYWFSVLDYAKLLYTQGNQDEKNLGWATYLYNKAANEYFDNNQGGQ